DLRVARPLELLKTLRVRLLVEVVAGDCLLPLQQSQLDDRRAAVLLGRTVEGQLVRSGAALARNELVERASMADLVLRDRRERGTIQSAVDSPRRPYCSRAYTSAK